MIEDSSDPDFTNDPDRAARRGLVEAYTQTAIPNMFNASGSAPMYACRAWVNFNGTGTVAIRASGNVSSITDNGRGQYTVNFATAMTDANYAVTGAGAQGNSSVGIDRSGLSAGSARVEFWDTSNKRKDATIFTVAIFR